MGLLAGAMLLLVAGCGEESSGRRDPEEVRAKLREIHAEEIAAAEAVFGKIIKARLENDRASLFDLATPREQDRLAGMAAFSAGVLAPSFPQLEEALAKYGIDADRVRPLQKVNLISPNSLRLALKSRGQALIKDLDDKRAFYLDLMPQVDAVAEQAAQQIGLHVKQLQAELQQAAREAKLVEPLVMGDKVKATMTTRIRGQPVQCVITFKRIDEEWLLDTESVFTPVKEP